MLGVVLMLVAAACNATSSVLQRRSARDEPANRAGTPAVLLDIARHPGWLLGIIVMLVGFVLHAVSISISRIGLVQPLLVAELPLTLLLASRVFHRPLPGRDWVALGMQAAGLGTFVGCLAVSGGDPNKVGDGTWALAVGITVAIIAGLVAASRMRKGRPRAAFLGAATGTAFGLNSSLIAGVGASVAAGGGLFTTWQTYGVAIVGPTSFLLLQSAMQAGDLVATQPGFTLLNPIVSVVWGLMVFDEQGRTGLFLLGTAAGAVLVVVGTVLLARSELLDAGPEQTSQESENEQNEPAG